jgi:hypothetical protein
MAYVNVEGAGGLEGFGQGVFDEAQVAAAENAPLAPENAPPAPVVVWTSLDPLPRWVPGQTTRWAPGTTRLVPHGT